MIGRGTWEGAHAGMRRREFVSLLGGAAAWPLAARAQQSHRVRRIGVLMGIAENNPQSAPRVKAMQEELHKLGWTEGRNLQMEFRWAAGDPKQVMALARELVDLQPDLIIAQGAPTTAALLQRTSTIPIVFVQVADPIHLWIHSELRQTWRERNRIYEF